MPRLDTVEHHAIRAPREDRTALVEPPAGDVGGLLERNRGLASQRSYDLQGRSLDALTRTARRELIREAQRWTSSYRDLTPICPTGGETILVAGHLPQMFHPGVWFKNFARAHLAASQAAVAVKYGMLPQDALRSITINPARTLGLEDRIGSIEPGKDADLAVFDGDPFDPASRVVMVFIDGRVVYEAGKEPK